MARQRCRSSWRAIGLIGLVICSLSGEPFVSSANAQDNLLVDRIRSEAPKAWLSYLHALADYQVDTQVISRNGAGVVTDKQTIRFVGAYPCCLVEVNTGAKHESVQGYNKEYQFDISRISGGQWVVKQLNPSRKLAPIEELSFPDYGQGRPLHSAGQETAVAMTKGLLVTIVDSLPMLFAKDGFRIAEAQEVKEDNLSLIRMKYSYEPDRFVPNQLARSGEVFLIPEHYWLIKRAKVDAVDPPNKRLTIETTNEYDTMSRPVPSLIKQRMVLNGGGYNNDTIEAINSGFSKTPNTDPKRFTLSAYGIPEPVAFSGSGWSGSGSDLDRSSLYLGRSGPDQSRAWLLGITLTLLAFCTVLLVYRRYRRWQRMKK